MIWTHPDYLEIVWFFFDVAAEYLLVHIVRFACISFGPHGLGRGFAKQTPKGHIWRNENYHGSKSLNVGFIFDQNENTHMDWSQNHHPKTPFKNLSGIHMEKTIGSLESQMYEDPHPKTHSSGSCSSVRCAAGGAQSVSRQLLKRRLQAAWKFSDKKLAHQCWYDEYIHDIHWSHLIDSNFDELSSCSIIPKTARGSILAHQTYFLGMCKATKPWRKGVGRLSPALVASTWKPKPPRVYVAESFLKP